VYLQHNLAISAGEYFQKMQIERALLFLLSIASWSHAVVAPEPRKLDLWHENQGGYKMYRIPGIVVTKAGTILAYAEARRYSGSDWGTIDIVMRRSTDGGRTFSPQRVIAHSPNVPRSPVAVERKQGSPDDVTYNNPVAIADHKGAVHFLFCREYMRVFYMRSDDDGVTFSEPVDVTRTFDAYRAEYDWKVAATGPGHGIHLAGGRLVLPVWLSLGTQGNGHSPSVTSTIYSDDEGKTWRAGDIAVHNAPATPDPNEATVVQTNAGLVLLNVRTQSGRNRRVVVTSRDGAHHWSEPRFQDDLPDPICFGSLVRFPRNKEFLLFSNPDNLSRADGKDTPSKDRRNLTVHLSNDGGRSWPAKKTIEIGPSSYSDLAVMPDGTILCLYEAGEKSAHEKIVLATFSLAWLADNK
jgi:sialidase-1